MATAVGTEISLGIPNRVQLGFVARWLKEMYKVDFPITREFGGVVRLSSHKIEGAVANSLRAMGYKIELRGDGRMLLTMPKGQHPCEVSWWFYNNDTTLAIEAWWRVRADGVVIILETDPLGGDSNHEEVAMLAHSLRDSGEKLRALTEEVLAIGSDMLIPW